MDNQKNPLIAEFDNLSPGLKAALAQTGQTMAGQAGAGGAAAPQGGALTMPHASPALPAGAPAPAAAATPPSLFSTPTPKMGTDVPGLFGKSEEAAPATIAPPAKKMPALPDINPRIQDDEDELTRKVKTGSGISQISGKVEGLMPNHHILGKILGGAAQGLATLGDVGLGAVDPALEMGLPGTQGHHQLLINRDESLLGHDYAHQKTAADTSHTNAQTGLTNAQTDEANTRTGLLPQEASDKHDLDQAQIANLNSEANTRGKSKFSVHDTEEGPVLYNEGTGDAQRLTIDGAAVGPKQKLTQSQPIIGSDGKPHTYLLDDKGNKKVDLGVHYEKPISVNTGDNHKFQEQERGRGLLDKAEGDYRTVQQGAGTMRDMLAQADAGNKMSAQMLPLEGALAITTSQGVHRINRTEVDQYSGGGSLYDKIVGELGKVTTGQPIPANIRADIGKLTDMQEHAAWKKYNDAHDSAVRRYGLENEQALPEPGGATAAASASGQAKGFVDVQKALSLPQYKGMSREQIVQEIRKHGYEPR